MRRLLLSLFLLSFIYSQNEYLVTVPATSYSNWVYYSFDNHSIVSIDNPENSLDWDLAFQRKHVRTNSGLSGPGYGGAIVDSLDTQDAEPYTWIEQWEELNDFSNYNEADWLPDTVLYDFYDLTTHTFIEGIKNPALNAWGWFDDSYVLNPTNYIMFVKTSDGEKIVKIWFYDYYSNGSGGNVSMRYQILNDSSCLSSAGDINEDGIINVVDVVSLVNFILLDDSSLQYDVCLFDYSGDGVINVVDVVGLVSFILNI